MPTKKGCGGTYVPPHRKEGNDVVFYHAMLREESPLYYTFALRKRVFLPFPLMQEIARPPLREASI